MKLKIENIVYVFYISGFQHFYIGWPVKTKIVHGL